MSSPFCSSSCLAFCMPLKSIKAVAVIFPFFIAALVPIRWGFNKIFTAEELHALDGYDDEEEESPNCAIKNDKNEEGFVSVVGGSSDDAPVLLGNAPEWKSTEASKSEEVPMTHLS